MTPNKIVIKNVQPLIDVLSDGVTLPSMVKSLSTVMLEFYSYCLENDHKYYNADLCNLRALLDALGEVEYVESKK